ncbi:hypothetical protein D9619_007997 [Psilocybe cf. subviscida]|uniref:Uncharacterized protein n=1 Tax=Psilocybe cf. subviscida TaxID=2480587 RepID=A0A8H5ATL1_9AGAR|nr:hypothetical protein D9619_007997 [Psilocybe cf. subviscida]
MTIWQTPQILTTCDADCQMGLRLLAKMAERPEQPLLGWTNVSVALAFILFDVGLSTVFRLGLGVSLVVASGRCMGQLTVVATLLHEVFENRNPSAVALIAFVFNFLGTFEIVINKSSRRFQNMFPYILASMLCSTIPISILGAHFSMGIRPFWEPIQYIPVIGMLCGSAISGVVVTINFLLTELQDNKDKIEIILAFGGTRREAVRPVVTQALRLALTAPINNMSVLGIISIPGMMTGAILGGASVQQAARLQMIIMFMIAASTTLASVFSAFAMVAVILDREHRVRSDRVYEHRGCWFSLDSWKRVPRRLSTHVKTAYDRLSTTAKEQDATVGERQGLLQNMA